MMSYIFVMGGIRLTQKRYLFLYFVILMTFSLFSINFCQLALSVFKEAANDLSYTTVANVFRHRDDFSPDSWIELGRDRKVVKQST